MSSRSKPRCFGCFLRYPAVVCMACRWWRECVGAGGGGGGADEAHGEPQILERERGKA
ncbi:MAG: hypothetical protein QXG09_04635 [Candidatus Bathyarchaeia archaeon]